MYATNTGPRRKVAAVALAATLTVGTGLAAACGVLGGHVYSVGDCVTTETDATGNSTMTKVSCGKPPTAFIYKVVEVISNADGICGGDSDTTFSDQPAGKTYCLRQVYVFGAPGG
ncbi:MAG: hypothetical protein ACM3ML_20220 [Micromonosporaceae bacterium]